MAAGEIIAVLDAGPLIHLDEVAGLHLLAGYREVLLPDIVEREVLRHRPAIDLSQVSGLVRVSAVPPLEESLLSLAEEFGLHQGELAAIAVLKEHHGRCLLSDDAAARALAEVIGFEVRGSVGLILRGWQREQISKAEAVELLHRLAGASSLHMRSTLLDQVLRQLNV